MRGANKFRLIDDKRLGPRGSAEQCLLEAPSAHFLEEGKCGAMSANCTFILFFIDSSSK